MPASRTTTRSASARSRTWSTRATSQPAPRDEEPPGLDGQARRPPVGGRASSSAASLAREVGGRRDRARVADREAAADVERVEALAARADAARAAPGPGGRRRATRRPRPAASRRGGGCRAPGAARPPRARATAAGQLGLGHAELRATRADGEAGVGLRRDVRVEAERGRRAAAGRRCRARRVGRSPAARRPPRGSRPRPSAAASPSAAARTAARRSAAVLPMPSSVIRSFGDAGPRAPRPTRRARRRSRPSPARRAAR